MTAESPGARAVFSTDALVEWSHHVESVLRGLAHSLNNRAAALSAVIELSREPDDDPASTREILETEMDRVQELVKVVRNIGLPRDDAEALAPAELEAELVAILLLHSDLRDRTVVFRAVAAPPVRVPRWMLMRALVAFGATRHAAPGERAITLTLVGDGDWLVVRAFGTGAPSRYAEELARAMGGEPLPGGSGFRIPSLESLRRREGR